jgi:hypothetical protein
MSESSASAPKVSVLAWILIVVAVLALVLGGLWWWHNRPIRPVQLNAQEKAVVEQKVEAIQKPGEPPAGEPVYEKGSKEITLTERELNHGFFPRFERKPPVTP